MKRAHIPASVRRMVLARDGWLCSFCKRPVGCNFEFEHTLPVWCKGTNESENITLAHPACHRPKTSAEHKIRAHMDRAGKKHRGEHKRTARPIPSRKNPWPPKGSRPFTKLRSRLREQVGPQSTSLGVIGR